MMNYAEYFNTTDEEWTNFFISLYDHDTKSIYISDKFLNEIVEFFKWNFSENKITYRVFRRKLCKDKKPITFWQKVKFFLFNDPTNEFLRIYLDDKYFIDISMEILTMGKRWTDVYLFLTKQVNMLKRAYNENKEN